MSEADKRNHVRKLNLALRHLNQAAKRQVVAEALKDEPEKSNRQHAEALGVSDKTVGAIREDLESTAEIPQLETRFGKDGKERTTKLGSRQVVATQKKTGPVLCARWSVGTRRSPPCGGDTHNTVTIEVFPASGSRKSLSLLILCGMALQSISSPERNVLDFMDA